VQAYETPIDLERLSLPTMKIDDAPHFPYRGFMLDCSRHFWDVETIKEVLDILAMHKMNRFHWHLTEDQGWRIEIKKTTGVKLVKDRLKDGLFLGWDVQEAAKKGDAHIVLYVDEYMGKEAYRLSVTPKRINIAAATPAGFFYALQTLKQLMPRNVMAGVRDESVKEWRVPCVFIVDEPRFSWREFMLDDGRHFYGKEEVKRLSM
jgi:N-acetyl-beta-hexosaminidase